MSEQPCGQSWGVGGLAAPWGAGDGHPRTGAAQGAPSECWGVGGFVSTKSDDGFCFFLG